jgi:hypothetical protein
LISSVPPAPATTERAELIWTAVSGFGVCTSHPASIIFACRTWTPCMVMIVFGAEVPSGRELKVWITGKLTDAAAGHA